MSTHDLTWAALPDARQAQNEGRPARRAAVGRGDGDGDRIGPGLLAGGGRER